jgi:hypothetical protein
LFSSFDVDVANLEELGLGRGQQCIYFMNGLLRAEKDSIIETAIWKEELFVEGPRSENVFMLDSAFSNWEEGRA